MSLLLLLLHQLIFVLQPFNWPAFAPVSETPYVAYTIVLAFVFFILGHRNKIIPPQIPLLITLLPIIVISAWLAGWGSEGLIFSRNFVLLAILPFLLYSNLMQNQKVHDMVIGLFLVYTFLMLSNGLSQLESADQTGWTGSRMSREGRITFTGILEDPNDLSGFFMICLPFAVYFVFRKRNLLIKLLGLTSFFVIIWGMVLANSRGGLVSIFAVIVGYLLYRYGNIKSVVIGLCMSPMAIYALDSFRTIEMDSSAEGRADAWYAGLQMLESNPVFGVGMNNFRENNGGLVAHNSFVHVMGELGIVGYSIWFTSIALSIWMCLHLLLVYKAYLADSGLKPEFKSTLGQAMAFNNTLFFSLLGYFVTLFFLSRSYTFFTFLLCAFAVASYYRVIKIEPSFAIADMRKLLRRIVAISLASIAGMYLVVKIVFAVWM